ncbi:MAG: hypothetical protein U1E86_07645 [Burkholderiaceae bacterium]
MLSRALRGVVAAGWVAGFVFIAPVAASPLTVYFAGDVTQLQVYNGDGSITVDAGAVGQGFSGWITFDPALSTNTQVNNSPTVQVSRVSTTFGCQMFVNGACGPGYSYGPVGVSMVTGDSVSLPYLSSVFGPAPVGTNADVALRINERDYPGASFPTGYDSFTLVRRQYTNEVSSVAAGIDLSTFERAVGILLESLSNALLTDPLDLGAGVDLLGNTRVDPFYATNASIDLQCDGTSDNYSNCVGTRGAGFAFVGDLTSLRFASGVPVPSPTSAWLTLAGLPLMVRRKRSAGGHALTLPLKAGVLGI